MAGLPIAGVKLIAEGQDQFLADARAATAAIEGIGTGAEQASQGMKALAEAAKRAEKIDQLNATLGTQRKELAILQTELSQTATKYGDASTQAQRKALAVEKLSQSIARTEGALKTEQQALAAAERAVSQFGDKTEQAGKGVSAFERIATGALHRVGEIAVNMAQEAAQALGRFAVDGIKAAGDFEAGTNRLASVAGDSLAQAGFSLDDVREKALQMGAETQFSAAQAQDAMIELAKGGVAITDVMGDATDATLNLAAAGEVELTRAAEIVAKQLGVWGDAAGGATAVSDLLAQAANASTVGVEDLALGLANAGGVAKVAGLTFQETVTTMAAISAGFSSASDAGTSLKTMLSRLQPATKPAAEAMAKLGLLTADGASKFYDAQGSFIGMAKAAELLKGATQGLSQAEKEKNLQLIFGQDAVRAAAILAEKGAAGYEAMAASMAQAGTAAAQAQQRQQGFNFALESLGGSLETLQIVLGTLLLPALTGLITNGLIPIVNGLTSFVQGTNEASAVVSTVAMPAITGLTTALAAYALVQTAQALPAILAMIPTIIAQTTAFIANAAAVVAAAAPYALLAVAVGGVAYAWQDLNTKISDGTTALLESKSWWTQSAAALQQYQAASAPVRETLKGKADALTQVRGQLQQEITDLANNETKWGVNSQQREQAMIRINSLANTVRVLGEQLAGETDAHMRASAAMMTGTTQLAALQLAELNTGNQAALTAEEIDKLGKAIEQTFIQGAAALGAYATTEAAFLTDAEARRSAHAEKIAELEKKKAAATTEAQRKGIQEQIDAANEGYQEQEQAAAESYANQQAAQQAHLGQMLIDYTVAQAQLGNISKTKAADLVAGIKQEFGVMGDTNSELFLRMTSTIDAFANDADGSIDKVVSSLGEQRDAAAETQQAMESASKEYVATAVANFTEKAGEAKAYAAELRAIPSRVVTEVHTKYTSSGTHGGNATPGVGGGSAGIGGRASGGPVSGGTPYIVGEQGPELFVPKNSGAIIDARETKALIARAVDGGRRAVQGVGDGIVQGAQAARQLVDRAAQAFGDQFGQRAAGAVEQQGPVFEQAGRDTGEVFGRGASDEVEQQGPVFGRVGGEAGSEFGHGASDAIEQGSGEIERAGRRSTTKAAQQIRPTAAQQALKEVGSPFTRGILEGVLAAAPDLFKGLGDTKDDMLAVFDDLGSKIGATIQEALSATASIFRDAGAAWMSALTAVDSRDARSAAQKVAALQDDEREAYAAMNAARLDAERQRAEIMRKTYSDERERAADLLAIGVAEESKRLELAQRAEALQQRIAEAKQAQAAADKTLLERRYRSQEAQDALRALGDEAAKIGDPRKRAEFLRMREGQIQELLQAQLAVLDAQQAITTPGGDSFDEANALAAADLRLRFLQEAQQAEQAAFQAGLITAADESGKAIGEGITQAVLANLGTIGTQFATVLTQALGGIRIEPRAAGGPVASGQPYLVGEQGPELMIPGRSGRIQPLARPAQLARMAAGGTTYGGATYNLNVTTQQSVGSIRAEFGLMQVMAGAS